MTNRDIRPIIIIGALLTAVMSAVCLFFSNICAIFCLILGCSLTIAFYIHTKKRYKKLIDLNHYLSLVCAGNYELDIDDNTEGELSILKNNLYKVITLLRTQNEQLKKDKTYLYDTLADISHQLKTPLTSMMVMTDLVKNEENISKKNEFLSIIETQLDKMKWLITNLLKLSKLDSGAIVFKNDKLSSYEIINESLKPFWVTLELKNIELKNNSTNFEFNGDKNWSIEAFENILKNCIEYTPLNGSITIESKCTNLYSSVYISDNGKGISDKDLPHIFERFYHGENSSKDSVGIGLSLAKTIIEKERGTIVASSNEGMGTTFEIRFYKSII